MKKAKRGYTLKRRPRKYQPTGQQNTIKAACAFCEIKKGMTKIELMDKMANCIPQYFREIIKESTDGKK